MVPTGKTKVPKEFIVWAEASCLVSLLFGVGVASLSSLVGFIYCLQVFPSY
jgi:hypothetical protein